MSTDLHHPSTWMREGFDEADAIELAAIATAGIKQPTAESAADAAYREAHEALARATSALAILVKHEMRGAQVISDLADIAFVLFEDLVGDADAAEVRIGNADLFRIEDAVAAFDRVLHKIERRSHLTHPQP